MHMVVVLAIVNVLVIVRALVILTTCINLLTSGVTYVRPLRQIVSRVKSPAISR